jgi:hypothetical protein
VGEAVRLTVRNEGYLPTHALSSALPLPHNEPLWLELSGDFTGPSRIEIGHLDGWGRGLFDGTDALYYQRGRGNTHERSVTVTARAGLRARAGSCRVGWVEIDV